MDRQKHIDASLMELTEHHFGKPVHSEWLAQIARRLTDEVHAPVVVFAYGDRLFGYVLPMPAPWQWAGDDDGK